MTEKRRVAPFSRESLPSKSKKPGRVKPALKSRSAAPTGRKKPTAQNQPTGRKTNVRAKTKPTGGGRKGGGSGGAAFRSPGRVQALGPIAGLALDGKNDGKNDNKLDKKARQTADSAEAAKAAIDAALDKKALLPVLIDVSSLASYTDFIGIVSGRSDRQVDAIAEGILIAMKARGRTLLGQEGSGSGRWTLLDFGDVVIHVFYHPVREFYDLESLWVDAPRIPLKIPPEAVMAQPDALYGNL
jgi:ribosome-associated protein